MFWCLNSTELFERPSKSGCKARLCSALLYGSPASSDLEHQEIVG